MELSFSTFCDDLLLEMDRRFKTGETSPFGQVDIFEAARAILTHGDVRLGNSAGSWVVNARSLFRNEYGLGVSSDGHHVSPLTHKALIRIDAIIAERAKSSEKPVRKINWTKWGAIWTVVGVVVAIVGIYVTLHLAGKI